MWQFIISGYVPGTDVQITFETLMTFSLSTFATLLVFSTLQKSRTAEREILALTAKINRIRKISL
jgi:hypothetical protein